VNGVSTFGIPLIKQIRIDMDDFPDRTSVKRLRRLGVKIVVLHTGEEVHELPESTARPRPPDPERAAERDVDDLGLVRHDGRGVVIYEVEDSP
jgi:hypothetical protein